MLRHCAQLTSSIYARLASSMLAYLVRLEDLFLSEPPSTMYRLSLLAFGHNNGSKVCVSNECSGETVCLPRLV